MKAEGATAVEREFRGTAVAVRCLLRSGAYGPRLGPLAVLSNAHEEGQDAERELASPWQRSIANAIILPFRSRVVT